MHILQIVIPFFIAGIGTCFAGILLDHYQHWQVFEKVDELFLILPALLGLKGNLQMTLASRFSTHSHLGHVQTQEDLLGLTCANLSLNQCLSIVTSLCASALATLIQELTSSDANDDRRDIIIVTVTALLTSSITSFLLDVLMIMLVHVASHFNLNPDNVAIPLAASLGDVTALILCSHLASLLYTIRDELAFYLMSGSIILVYILLVPIWIAISRRNPHTESVISKAEHWYPLITAMIISTLGGLILKTAVSKSGDIALYQPVICGVGGNLAAVQASRLATHLHRECELGELPAGEQVCMNPCQMFCSNELSFKVSRILMLVVTPGQLCFYFICILLNNQRSGISLNFLLLYLFGSQVLVILLLYLAYVLTFVLWSCKVDPDSSTIPYLTSISDVLGAIIISLICLVASSSRLKVSEASLV